MKRGVILFSVVLVITASASWYFRDQIVSSTSPGTSSDAADDATHVPDPVKYAQLKKELAVKRTELARQYRNAQTAAEKNAVLKRTRFVLESYLLEMTHCWRGTPWDFNGTCKTPGSGEIACGYFVSTVLQDTGVKCERIRLAQQPSQRIIATFLKRSDMHICAGVTYDKFLKQEIARGAGWRIVGLDRHVGFLVIEEDGSTRFIHSNPGSPQIVLDEPREKSAYLRNSNYRVTGNITANKQLLVGWLAEKNWPTKTGQ